MSSMLDQAIIDATALREAAIQSAEQAVVEKYSTEIKEAVEQLMEENDFEENKTVDEQIVEADEKGEGYAFVEDTELSDLEQNDLVDIDVKALFEEVQQEQLQEEVEIDDELLEEDVEISEELIDQLVKEVMAEGSTVEGDEDGDGDVDKDDVKKAVDRVTNKILGKTYEEVLDEEEETLEEESSKDKCPPPYKAMQTTDGKIVCVMPVGDARPKGKMEEEIKMDFEPTPVGQTTAFGATRAQQAEQAMLMDVMLAIEEENAKLEKKNETLVKTGASLKESNQKLKETVKNIAEKFEEIKLMNSKLFYTNQTLMDDSLNERQKGNLVESINNAQTSEQAKIVYETLKSTVGNAITNKQPESLSEAVGKRSSTSLLLKAQKSDDKPKVNESNILADRMQILAGIKHHKED